MKACQNVKSNFKLTYLMLLMKYDNFQHFRGKIKITSPSAVDLVNS